MQRLNPSTGNFLYVPHGEKNGHIYPDSRVADLMFDSRISGAAQAQGLTIESVATAAAATELAARGGCRVVVADLTVPVGMGSGLAGLSLAYNVADESDLILGLFVPWGRGLRDVNPMAGTFALGSEFGLSPLLVYLESRVFF